MTERIINPTETIYKNFEIVAKLLEAISPNNKKYVVENTYLDYGQDWKWTTIIREDKTWGGVQVLSPRDWEEIVNATTLAELGKITDDIRNGKYFGDK